MDSNVALLRELAKNARMGAENIDRLLNITHDPSFKGDLKTQKQGYEHIRARSEDMLRQRGETPPCRPCMDGVKGDMMMGLQTAMDKSVPHLAEMMVLGSNMGVVSALKSLRQYADAEPGVRELVSQLKQFEEDNANRMKQYL